jgi:VWFA-related protein
MHHGILGGSRGHPSQASANNPAPDFLSISGNPCNHSIQLPKSSTLIFFPRRNAPMRPSKLVLASSVLLLSATLLCGQKLSAQNSPASPSSTVPSLRVNAREVVVDVNVTDAKGNPVHGLTQDNFTVLEDGRPMVPRSFREHRSDQKPAESPAAARPSLPPNTFTNATAPETARPLNILMIDSLDTPIATQSIVQKRMVDFADKAPAGTRVAVFSLSPTGKLSLVQGFTTDQQLLKNAIKSKKLNLGVPSLEDSGQDINIDISEDMFQGQAAPKQSAMVAQPKATAFNQDVECQHAAERGQYTLSAMAEISRYVSGMPGRKNLLWYSGGFPDRMRDKQGSVCYDFREDLSVAEGLLGNSHVVVYPVDSRALDLLAKNAPDSRIVRTQATEHLVMEGVAESTGGKTFFNTNDLAGAAQQAIDTGANYYTIIYAPTNQTMDTRRRSITVKVDQPDLNLLYRHGYHALPPNTTLSGKPVDKATPLQTAMMRGALQPTEILFHVTVALAPATDATLPPGSNPDPKAMKPPYRHLTLNYLIDINGIQFDLSDDGNYHGQFEYAVNVYDTDDGKLVNSGTMAAKPALADDAYESMLEGGAKLRQEIAVPAKGEYILRIGVHDLATGHLGVMEVPVSAITPQAAPK